MVHPNIMTVGGCDVSIRFSEGCLSIAIDNQEVREVT